MRELGTIGERLAMEYLKAQGYKILEKNYRCSVGEVDIIAQDQDTIVFVEVKTRRNTFIAAPYESVGKHKQKKILEVAQCYLEEKDLVNHEIRFDVLSIVMRGATHQIEHLREAF